jgi:hypothetical protein
MICCAFISSLCHDHLYYYCSAKCYVSWLQVDGNRAAWIFEKNSTSCGTGGQAAGLSIPGPQRSIEGSEQALYFIYSTRYKECSQQGRCFASSTPAATLAAACMDFYGNGRPSKLRHTTGPRGIDIH